MGDRASCTLRLFGAISRADADELHDLLRAAGAEVASEDHIETGPASFSFSEVNYAALDGDVERFIRTVGLSYAWANDHGDEYSAGLLVRDGVTGETCEFATAAGAIALTLSEIDNPARLEAARRWDARLADDKSLLLVYDSQHHLFAQMRAGVVSPDLVKTQIAAVHSAG